MTNKKAKKSKTKSFYVRRSYEPVKMTVAVSAAAATMIILLVLIMFAW